MLKIHYDLLHKVAEMLDALPYRYDNRTTKSMEDDPDAYLASVLNLTAISLKHRESSRPLSWVIDPADYKPYMKKMRKLLDQNPGEYTPTM